MPGKRRALLIGYYGEQNAGDDAFFELTARAARTLCRVDEIVRYGHGALTSGMSDVRNLFPFPDRFRGAGRLNRLSASWISRRVHHVILGGGSILHTGETIREYCALVERAGAGPHFAAGVSIGPFADEESEIACCELLKMLAFVGVRDRASLARGRALAPDARIELTFDLAPLLTLDGPVAGTGPRQSLGIALCNYERFIGGDTSRETARVAAVAEAVREAAAKGIIDAVTLLDFSSHPHRGDRAVHRALADGISGSVPVRHVPYSGNPHALLREVAALKGILAMRLHAAVFAFCTDTPVTMLSYHEKCGEWARMAMWPDEWVLDAGYLETGVLGKAISRMMDAQDATEGIDLADAVRAAQRNFAWLDLSKSDLVGLPQHSPQGWAIDANPHTIDGMASRCPPTGSCTEFLPASPGALSVISRSSSDDETEPLEER